MFELGLSVRSQAHGGIATLSEAAGLLASVDLDQGSISHLRAKVDGDACSDLQSVEQLGRLVGGMVFGGEVGQSLADRLSSGPIRLRLKLEDPLSWIPVEAAFLDRQELGFLAIHPNMRMLREGMPCNKPALTNDVKILLAIANPANHTFPDMSASGDEAESICSAMRSPECARCQTKCLEHATPNALLAELNNGYHVFHFIGHGGRKPTGGFLILEGARAQERETLYVGDLAAALVNSGASIAVLSACLTGGDSSGIGAELARDGLPVVLAMQSTISDRSAHLFSRTFYAALGEGQTVEDAVWQGRNAILGRPDWFAPVLTTGVPEMRLVDRAPMSERKARGNLPQPLTSFIGRKAEIRRVEERLRAGRMLTLLGSGGIGKTRLSVEIARNMATSFAAGAWQVLLESVERPEGVIEAIAAVFGIRDSSEKPIVDRLFEFLYDQQLLLVLDNCEHLVDACRQASQRILEACPEVKILATSREVLHVPGEHLERMPPLSYPSLPPEDEPWVLKAEQTIASFEALQLLEGRARSARSDFKLDEGNIESACRIVARLDGIPLAIELAAARMRSFSVSQILERLTKSLSWLDIENPGNVPRHKTLRAALEWSYKLLPAKERVLFDRLGVFIGGLSLESACKVAGFAPLEAEEVPDLLTSLVDKSLVVADELAGEMRYRLLDTCRHYAMERMEERGETAALRDRHLDCMGGFASLAIKSMLSGKDQQGWSARTTKEHDNLLAAIEWALGGGGAPEKAGQLARDLFFYWFMIGRFDSAKRTINRILDKLDPRHEELRIEMMTLSGAAGVYSGESEGIERIKWAYDEGLGKFPDLAEGFVATWLLDCAYMLGHDDLTVEVGERLLARVAQGNTPKNEGMTRLNLGNVEIARGNLLVAKQHFESVFQVRSQINDDRGANIAICHLANVKKLLSEEGYKELYDQGLHGLAALGDSQVLAWFLLLASDLLMPQRPTQAASVQGFALKLQEESGGMPDRYVWAWGQGCVQRTKEALGRDYELWQKNGRILSLEEALNLLSSAPYLQGQHR